MRFNLILDGKGHSVELGLDRAVTVLVDGKPFEAVVERTDKGMAVKLDGHEFLVRLEGSHLSVDGKKHDVEVRHLRRGKPSWLYEMDEEEDEEGGGHPRPVSMGEGVIHPPMPGRVVSIKVAEGEKVKIGTPVLVLEAMKMQNELVSPTDGIVKEIRVSEGDLVETKDILILIGS